MAMSPREFAYSDTTFGLLMLKENRRRREKRVSARSPGRDSSVERSFLGSSGLLLGCLPAYRKSL